MGAMMERIAVIDDKLEGRESMADLLLDAGYEPVPFDEIDYSIDVFLRELRSKADGAVFDQHLKPGNYANFNGCDAVARLYDMNFPSILVTELQGRDLAEITAKKRKIPVYISSLEGDSELIRTGLESCVSEFGNALLPDRIPYRTLVRIDTIDLVDEHRPFVDLVIPAWNPHTKISIPYTYLQSSIDGDLAEDMRFFAEVNIGALRPQDVYFDNFEVAKGLDDEYNELLHS